MTILRVLVVLGGLYGVAAADTITAGAAGGAAIGSAPDAEVAGLFVRLDGAVDWHPTAGVALGAEAQAWTINRRGTSTSSSATTTSLRATRRPPTAS